MVMSYRVLEMPSSSPGQGLRQLAACFPRRSSSVTGDVPERKRTVPNSSTGICNVAATSGKAGRYRPLAARASAFSRSWGVFTLKKLRHSGSREQTSSSAKYLTRISS